MLWKKNEIALQYKYVLEPFIKPKLFDIYKESTPNWYPCVQC